MKLTERYRYAALPSHSTNEKAAPIGMIAFVYFSRSIDGSACTTPAFIRPNASAEQKTMCHIVSVIGNGKPATAQCRPLRKTPDRASCEDKAQSTPVHKPQKVLFGWQHTMVEQEPFVVQDDRRAEPDPDGDIAVRDQCVDQHCKARGLLGLRQAPVSRGGCRAHCAGAVSLAVSFTRPASSEHAQGEEAVSSGKASRG